VKPFHPRSPAWIAAILVALGAQPAAQAQVDVGTWVRTITPATPGTVTMTVEVCCKGGRRLTYDLADAKQKMLVESPLDGNEVPVLLDGKPSGQTMAITRIDSLRTSTVVKMNGKPFGISKATMSNDGKTLVVENDFSASVGGGPVGKFRETWVRK